MNLKNYSIVKGFYRNNLIELISNEVIVSLNDGFIFKKLANKRIWTTCNLKFTLFIDNINNSNKFSFNIMDVLDPSYLELITGSVTINNVPAAFKDYSYDSETGLLSFFLNDVFLPITINFKVRKKKQVFKLFNKAYLKSNSLLLESNAIFIYGFLKKFKCPAYLTNLKFLKNYNSNYKL